MDKAFVDTSVILRILVKEDDGKVAAVERLLLSARRSGKRLHVLPVAILEVVWVLEKVYKLDRRSIRELADAILNTGELIVENGEVFRKALAVYEEKNVKFADAVMGAWGIARGLKTVYTYDEKDFRRIGDLEVLKP
ncbi:PIN domain-containing protein [Candidatus Deferrimicrobium sp.]|jgi:predicted nucleic-acid-binding protein|uniref:PIN domain-containing protein n=1 Tax=Candidatus Deferrimicrobium sp. TaxID=3060586 RepID=UPI002ED870F8